MGRDLFVMCVIVFLADYDVFLRRTAFFAFLGRAGLAFALVGLRLAGFAFFGLVAFLVLATFFAFFVRAGLVGFVRFFFRRFIRLAVSRSCGSVALAIAEGTCARRRIKTIRWWGRVIVRRGVDVVR